MREGEAIVAAAESGALPLAPPAAPEIDPAEAAVLFAAGYDAENIADTNPEERAECQRRVRERRLSTLRTQRSAAPGRLLWRQADAGRSLLRGARQPSVVRRTRPSPATTTGSRSACPMMLQIGGREPSSITPARPEVSLPSSSVPKKKTLSPTESLRSGAGPKAMIGVPSGTETVSCSPL